MGRGGKRRPSGRGGLWQGGLGRDEQCGWGGRKETGYRGTRRAGQSSVRATWVVRNGMKRNGTGQDGAQRNKAGRASGAGGVGQTASAYREQIHTAR